MFGISLVYSCLFFALRNFVNIDCLNPYGNLIQLNNFQFKGEIIFICFRVKVLTAAEL